MLAAVDIGGTKTLVALGDDAAKIRAERRLETRAADGGDQLVDRVVAALSQLAASQAVSLPSLSAVGIGVGGPLRRTAGVLLDPPQLGWGEYPLGARFLERSGLPAVIDNDCNLGALGEHRYGAGRGKSSLLYFGIGTGIGGGVIVGGQLHHGASDNAGELGRLIVDVLGREESETFAGTVESYGSGRGLALRAASLARAGRAPALLARAGSPEAITAADVAALAEAGDAQATTLWQHGIAAVAAGIASMLNALSPDVVVLGGGLPAHAGAPYVAAVARAAHAAAFGPNATASVIVRAELAERSVVVGALALAAERSG